MGETDIEQSAFPTRIHPLMASAAVPRHLQKLCDLEITVVSAKHLKNVNWRKGDLKPYVILWLHPDRRQATKPDDSGSTRPVWNERFVLPLAFALRDSVLTLEIFHSKPSETPKPLVGALRFELRDLLVNSDQPEIRLRTFELQRPSGRPQGKIRLKLGLIESAAENYHTAPHSGYYYSSAPPPPMPYRGGYTPAYSSIPPPQPASFPPPPPPPASYSPPPQPQPYYSYSDPPSGYYSPYYSVPQPASSFSSERQSIVGGAGPSAPVDYTPYDYPKRNSQMSGIGMGTGLAVGAVAGALGGLALEEGVKYEEEKLSERVENDLASTAKSNCYGDYRRDY